MSAFKQKYQGKIRFLHINIDDAQSQPLMRTYNVHGTPTIVLLNKNGTVAANVAGWPGDQAVADALDRLVVQP